MMSIHSLLYFHEYWLNETHSILLHFTRQETPLYSIYLVYWVPFDGNGPPVQYHYALKMFSTSPDHEVCFAIMLLLKLTWQAGYAWYTISQMHMYVSCMVLLVLLYQFAMGSCYYIRQGHSRATRTSVSPCFSDVTLKAMDKVCR